MLKLLLAALLLSPSAARAAVNAPIEAAAAGRAALWQAHFEQSPLPASLSADQTTALSRLLGQVGNLEPASLSGLAPREQTVKLVDAVRYLAQRSVLKAEGLQASPEQSYSAWELSRVEQGLQNLQDLELVSPALPGLKRLAGLKAVKSDIEELTQVLREKQAALAAPAETLLSPLADNPVAAPQKAPAVWVPPTGITLHIPTAAEIVKFGGKDWKRLYFPTEPDGTPRDDIPSAIAQFNELTRQQLILAYEERLDEDVDSIIKGVDRGNEYIVVLEASHLWPKTLSPAAHGAQSEDGRSPQVQRLIDKYLDLKKQGRSSLQLFGIKGLGSIGILHHKNRIGRDDSGAWIATNGSSNFTDTSLTPMPPKDKIMHYETFGFTDDQARVELMKQNFAWVLSMADPFTEDWTPHNPAIDYAKIPLDLELGVTAYGTKFPRLGFSPVRDPGKKGDPLADPTSPLHWLATAMRISPEAPFFFMFAFFPPPALKAEFYAAAKRLGAPTRALIDYGQLHNPVAHPYAVLELAEAGALDVRTTAGPDEAPFDPRNPHSQHSKLHRKEAYFGRELAKMLDSWNLSANATFHNFELWQFLTDIVVAQGREYAEEVWKTAYRPSLDELRRWIGRPRSEQAAP